MCNIFYPTQQITCEFFLTYAYLAVISCRTINAPSNGQITAGQKEQYVVGNTLSFICNNGFAIRGSSILTCQESGFWDVQPPICLGA